MIRTLALLAVVSAAGSTIGEARAGSAYAACNHRSHGLHGWFGPTRSSYKQAKADARAHNRSHPGHSADVIGFVSLTRRPAAQGPSIGVPRGTSYVVLSTSMIRKPALAQCGFNAASSPKPGLFRREVRRYRTYDKGKIVNQYVRTVDVFIRCLPH